MQFKPDGVKLSYEIIGFVHNKHYKKIVVTIMTQSQRQIWQFGFLVLFNRTEIYRFVKATEPSPNVTLIPTLTLSLYSSPKQQNCGTSGNLIWCVLRKIHIDAET